MAIYGSMEAPKNHQLTSLMNDAQPSDWTSNGTQTKNQNSISDGFQTSGWTSNGIQVDCDNFASASDACMKKNIFKKRRFGLPGRLGYRAGLGNRLLRRNNNNNIKRPIKKGANLGVRDWSRASVHPFINFLRIYRRKFARNMPAEEIARRGRCEWRKMSCKSKEKYYEQAQKARIRGYKI